MFFFISEKFTDFFLWEKIIICSLASCITHRPLVTTRPPPPPPRKNGEDKRVEEKKETNFVIWLALQTDQDSSITSHFELFLFILVRL